ncbi:hypothetical protein [Porphyromonas sp.]
MNIFGREVGGGEKPKKPLQLVQRGTDTRIPLELVAQPSGEVLDLSRFERLSVKIFNDAGTECATPPTDIQDNHLIVEVTADTSQHLGTGVYSVEVTGRVADTAFADGYHDYTIRTALCRVTSDGSDATPTKVTANVIESLRGLSAYEIAVKHGYQGTEEEWAKSLVGNDGADAYEVAKKAGYAGSREEWLKTLIGATGLSAYELAKAEGYEGSLTEWIASLKGADGDSAYKVAVRNGYVGSEWEWLESLKNEEHYFSREIQGEAIVGLMNSNPSLFLTISEKLIEIGRSYDWNRHPLDFGIFMENNKEEVIESLGYLEKDISREVTKIRGIDIEWKVKNNTAYIDMFESFMKLIEMVARRIYLTEKEKERYS